MADTRQPTTPTTGEDDVEPSPIDDSETRAFISGWNARARNELDFDRALHFWTRERSGIYGAMDIGVAALAAISPTTEDVECPSCGGLNTSCPDGCGIDPKTGELNGTRLERPEDAEKRELVEALGDLIELARPNVYPQPDKPDSPYAKLERARALLASIGERS